MHPDQIGRYERSVAKMLAHNPLDVAMAAAVGGNYEQVGKSEADLLVRCGLNANSSIIDIGCGSGRLSTVLGQRFPELTYLGTDILQPLLDYAAGKAPTHFRFVRHPGPDIPSPDASADFVVAFSLFTHLLYEQSFAYLEEMKRVTKPGGLIVFSFLEMRAHWHVFEWARTQIDDPDVPLNMFMERSGVEVWIEKLGLTLEGYDQIGQTVAIVRRT